MSTASPRPAADGDDAEEVSMEIEAEHEDKVTGEPEEQPSAEPVVTRPPSPLRQSLENLAKLNGALSEFLCQWGGLQRTFDSIASSIEALGGCANEIKHGEGKMIAVVATLPDGGGVEEKSPSDDANAPKAKDRAAELLTICETMSGKALRKFIGSHLSEIEWLRHEVPAALNRAPLPAKLVLDAIGRFYLQGSKAFDRGSSDPMVVGRRASILLLEFYVLSGCCATELEEPLKQETKTAALSWRSRLKAEGGVESARAVDALGLVLFLASFGIPKEFGCKDIFNLLRLSNLKKKADVLRQSPILQKKMPDIILDMQNKEMHVEAVDLICAFRLKEKFPPMPLLSSYLLILLQAEEREKGQNSLRSLKESNEKKLAKLKSVVKCLEDNKLDPSELASFNINQKIFQLVNDISVAQQKLKNDLKRMAQDLGPSGAPAKQPRHASAKASPVTPFKNMLDRSTVLHNGNGTSLRTGSILHSPGTGSGLIATGAAHAAGLVSGNSFGSVTNIGGGSYVLHGSGSLGGQGLLGPAPSAAWMDPNKSSGQSLFYPQTTLAGARMESTGANLYHFADTVLERESSSYHGNLGTNNDAPSASNRSYYSSYGS